MQSLRAIYLKFYVLFSCCVSAYSLIQVMNTHQQGWLGVLLTSLPATAFFLRLFTDKKPRTESKLIAIHLLAIFGVVVTALSEPTLLQMSCAIAGLVFLFLYDFWASAAHKKPAQPIE